MIQRARHPRAMFRAFVDGLPLFLELRQDRSRTRPRGEPRRDPGENGAHGIVCVTGAGGYGARTLEVGGPGDACRAETLVRGLQGVMHPRNAVQTFTSGG